MRPATAVEAYADSGDLVRERFETAFFGSLLRRLVPSPGEILDLGCGDGLVARLAGPRAARYVGVDIRAEGASLSGTFVGHDLRDGLGPVGRRPFDLYLATFGLASHLHPNELARLLGEVARHGRPGALVAIEALGLRSLEWPGLWDAPIGPARTIPYRLAAEVEVHPWLPDELAMLYLDAGIEPLLALDRTLQAGPKLGRIEGWPGLPALRPAMDCLLKARWNGPLRTDAVAVLSEPLPPLPAGPAAALHHELAARRRSVVAAAHELPPPSAVANAIWRLEPATGGGFGHGLTLIGRIR
jgi:SAM-dependent methyltransferase